MNLISRLLSSWGVSSSYVAIVAFLISLAIIIAIAYAAHILFKIYLHARLSKYADQKSPYWGRSIIEARIIHRLSHLLPAMIIYTAVPLLSSPDLAIDTTIIRFIQSVMLLYILISCVLVFNSMVYITENLYKRRKGSKRHSIKSYVQVLRILVYFLSAIAAVAIVVNKSPIALFTGLFGTAAVLSFVFKDSITGFVASVQLSSYDIVRVGDWIVIPKYGADGDVLEISLNTVKIQNFDKTITTVPTSALLTEGVTNWRGMEESGGRRIKRSIYLDIKSVKFCDEGLLSRLKKLHYLKDYIKEKEEEIEEAKKGADSSHLDNIANGKELSNLGLFRAYAENYVMHHPKIHKDMTLLVRHLQPTELGLPLEIYIFTNDTNWGKYEAIQSEIFEHLLPTLGTFELKIYQR